MLLKLGWKKAKERKAFITKILRLLYSSSFKKEFFFYTKHDRIFFKHKKSSGFTGAFN
jgi:hypothetical protein